MGKSCSARMLGAALAPGLLAAYLGVLVLAAEAPACASREARRIMEEKASRSPAQRKVDSQLLQAAREARGEPAQPGAPHVRSRVEIDSQGRVLVDIDATVTAALLERIAADGGGVIGSFPRYDAIRARMPLDKLEDVAALPEVRFIHAAAEATTNEPPGSGEGGGRR